MFGMSDGQWAAAQQSGEAEPPWRAEPAEPAGRAEPPEPAGRAEPPEPAGRAEPPEPPWRSAPRRRGVPRPQLSRDVVVAAALKVLEAEGGGALTMRRVADQIGVSASALYGYVANKEELIQLVLDRIFDEIQIPPPDGRDWQDWIKDFARAQLDMYRRHPGVAGLTLGRVVVTSGMLAGIEQMLGVLRAAGLPDQVAVFVGDLGGLYVAAYAYELEVAPPGDAERFRDQFGSWLRSLPPERFPNLLALAGKMAAGDADDRFEWGLDVIIRGLASYLEVPPDPRARWPAD
jgi:TetR/AcrR family transcriptional regulator, tetracycline repressor protein